MEILNRINKVLVFLFPVLLMSCSESNEHSVERSSAFNSRIVENNKGIEIDPVGQLSSDYMDTYADLKKASSQSEEKKSLLFKQLLQRTAMADFILSSTEGGDHKVQLELLEVRNNIIINSHFSDVLSRSVSENNIKSYYESHAEEFMQWQFHLSYILIPAGEVHIEKGVDNKGNVVSDVISRLDKGDEFEQVDRELTDSGYVIKRDVMTLMDSDKYLNELVGAARELRVGQVSPPVKVSSGVYFIKHFKEPVSIRKEFSDVKSEIVYKLRDQARRNETKRLLEEIKSI